MEAEYCRIERWRGYLSSSFYVHLPDQTLESRSFRWRSQAPPPNDGAARAAYDELVGRVERAGWTRHADGADWFATTFTRFVETPKEVRLERVADVMPQERPPMRVVAPVQQSPRPPEPRPREPQPELRRPEPPTAPVRSRGRRWLAPAAVSAFVVAAVAAGFLILEQRASGRPAVAEGLTRTVAAHLSAGSSGSAAVTKDVEGFAHSVVAKAVPTDLRIAAHGNGSWLEIRRGSATGPILYSATLTDGQTLHFRAPKLWGRFGAASNLTIVANARPVRIQGTYEKLFVTPR